MILNSLKVYFQPEILFWVCYEMDPKYSKAGNWMLRVLADTNRILLS